MRRTSTALTFLLAAATSAAATGADRPLLHPLFSDRVVLQRDRPVTVWGWSEAADEVVVSLAGATAPPPPQRTPPDPTTGRWEITLPARPAGGPWQLRVEAGSRSVVAHDVLFGDVWLCSGQSNMAMPLHDTDQASAAMAHANWPEVRVCSLPLQLAAEPQEVPAGVGWRAMTPQTAGAVSAVAFHFAAKWREHTRVPVGLIIAAVGGTSIDVWMSAASLGRVPASADALDGVMRQRDAERALTTTLADDLDAWFADFDPGSADHNHWAAPELDDAGWLTSIVPGRWWTQHYPDFTGVVWYRHEVVLTAAQAAAGAVLQFGFPRDFDTAFVNGRRVGAETNRVIRRRYPIPAGTLRAGRNVIAVRLLARDANAGFGHSPDQFALACDGGPPVPLAGPWRTRRGIGLADAKRPVPDRLTRAPDRVTLLHNAMIHPLRPFTLRGFVWYQGENDLGRPDHYRTLLGELMRGWREEFRATAAPFVVIQLPRYDVDGPAKESWPALREAQRLAVASTPRAALAVTWDTGCITDIHPRDKAAVGQRAAHAALALEGFPGGALSPAPLGIVRSTESIVIHFGPGESPLSGKVGALLEGFALVDLAGVTHPVAARCTSPTTVCLPLPTNFVPTAVRFAWADAPIAALSTRSGLPVVPFELRLGRNATALTSH
ncbi:MAG: sialate O-acetylesterase [Lacunisphaera sp.]|nr:sialate O-acetylesterase [Lacunisphaera sp.]